MCQPQASHQPALVISGISGIRKSGQQRAAIDRVHPLSGPRDQPARRVGLRAAPPASVARGGFSSHRSRVQSRGAPGQALEEQ